MQAAPAETETRGEQVPGGGQGLASVASCSAQTWHPALQEATPQTWTLAAPGRQANAPQRVRGARADSGPTATATMQAKTRELCLLLLLGLGSQGALPPPCDR